MATTDNDDYLAIHRHDADEAADATAATVVYQSKRAGRKKEITGWVKRVDRETVPVDGDFILILDLPNEARQIRARPNASNPMVWSKSNHRTCELGDLVRLWLDYEDPSPFD